MVELEEQQLVRLQGAEGPLAAGLPEVDLVEVRLAPEIAEPVVVGDGDSQAHGGSARERTILAEAGPRAAAARRRPGLSGTLAAHPPTLAGRPPALAGRPPALAGHPPTLAVHSPALAVHPPTLAG